MRKLEKFKDWLEKQNNLNTLSITITTALNIGWDERSHTLKAYLIHLKEDGDSIEPARTVNIDHLIDLLNIEK